ncbi:hypothetical protein D3C73_1215910 [compost metagenome]
MNKRPANRISYLVKPWENLSVKSRPIIQLFTEREIKLPSGSAAGIATHIMWDPGSVTEYTTYILSQVSRYLFPESAKQIKMVLGRDLPFGNIRRNEVFPEKIHCID